MEILFDTANIWEIDTDVDPRGFVEALATILQVGDIVVFGAYEPTPELSRHLIAMGATQKSEISELYTSFDLNRDEHPNGCAFELIVAADTFRSLFARGPSVLCQRDVSRFFDHAVAYRPATPRVPLFSFHDAFHGGLLFLSGAYDEKVARHFSSQLAGSITSVCNLHMIQTEEG
jgi:hypothetical protein